MQPKNLIFENRNYQSDPSVIVDLPKRLARNLPAKGLGWLAALEFQPATHLAIVIPAKAN
ncbi:MAG: hypothetical protein WD342_11135 [Verrucomicrobiales bacterium]